jgi:hypothetical protein
MRSVVGEKELKVGCDVGWMETEMEMEIEMGLLGEIDDHSEVSDGRVRLRRGRPNTQDNENNYGSICVLNGG